MTLREKLIVLRDKAGISQMTLAHQLGDHRAFTHAGGTGQNNKLPLLFLTYHSSSSSFSPFSSPFKRLATVSG